MHSIWKIAVRALLLFCLPTLSAQTRHDLYIHVGAGDSLDATYYVPQLIKPSAGYPALLIVHGFGLNKDEDTLNCRQFAQYGILSLCYSVRGQGKSSGTSGIMDGRERSDLRKVLAFLRAMPLVDSTSIGIMGGSQGGLHGLWAIVDSLGVQAVSTDVIIPTWASDMFTNGSIRRTFSQLLHSPQVRYDAVRDTLWGLLRRDSFDSLKSLFAAPRDLDTVKISRSHTPLASFLKWQDHYFSPAGGIESFVKYQGVRKMYVGTVGHYSDPSTGESQFQYDQVNRWFRYFLLHEATGILSEPSVTYAYSSLPVDSAGSFTWTHTQIPAWPPTGIQLLRLYFAPDSSLAYSVSGTYADSVVVRNEYRNTAYTFDTAFVEGFKGPRFDAALPRRSFAFTSAPLPQGLQWVGAPHLVLFVSSASGRFPLHAQVFEVDSVGGKHFVNRINYESRTWHAGASGTIEATGIPHAHMFSRGSRIRIELTNIDVAERPSFGSYPFVLPLFADVSVTVRISSAQPSYVELPVIGTPGAVAESFDVVPLRAELRQNYPNPFNPSTTIPFTLTDRALVSLKIYNILGEETASLIQKELQAGSYQVRWDARGSPSGVYFAQLVSWSSKNARAVTREVRKMMVLR